MRTQRSARPSRIAAAHRVDLVRCRSRRRLDDRPLGGFQGFADQTEAEHAAWVAYRALGARVA